MHSEAAHPGLLSRKSLQEFEGTRRMLPDERRPKEVREIHHEPGVPGSDERQGLKSVGPHKVARVASRNLEEGAIRPNVGPSAWPIVSGGVLGSGGLRGVLVPARCHSDRSSLRSPSACGHHRTRVESLRDPYCPAAPAPSPGGVVFVLTPF